MSLKVIGYITLPLEDDMLDRLVGLLGAGDNGKVDDVGSFDTKTVCSFPANKIMGV